MNNNIIDYLAWCEATGIEPFPDDTENNEIIEEIDKNEEEGEDD